MPYGTGALGRSSHVAIMPHEIIREIPLDRWRTHPYNVTSVITGVCFHPKGAGRVAYPLRLAGAGGVSERGAGSVLPGTREPRGFGQARLRREASQLFALVSEGENIRDVLGRVASVRIGRRHARAS